MRRLPGVFFLTLAMSAPAGIAAQDTQSNRYTLEDLGGVYVRMEVADACEAAGVTASDFEASVSLSLLDSEVGVLTMEEMLQHPALPELRVTIDCAAGANGTGDAMAYSVELRVQQSAQMLRDTQITLPEAVTWFASDVGVTGSASAAEAVGATLEELVASFATAWMEVNADEGGA